MATVTGINSLIPSSWNGFQKVKTNPFVVKNSIPILWFGDMDAYFQSDKQILTVALNPSDKEFKLNNSTNNSSTSASFRFKNAQKYALQVSLSNGDIKLYKDDMNNYFKYNPYKKWFSQYEKILNVLDSSYYPNKPNKLYKRHSIHIDLYSPAATTPTWGRLKRGQQQSISSCFNGLFSNLLNYLKPDVVIISVNRSIIDKTFLNNLGLPCSAPNAYRYYNYLSPTNKKGYINVYEFPSKRILICGRNWNLPFAMLNVKTVLLPQIKIIKNLFNI